jgi:hypothetical protein
MDRALPKALSRRGPPRAQSPSPRAALACARAQAAPRGAGSFRAACACPAGCLKSAANALFAECALLEPLGLLRAVALAWTEGLSTWASRASLALQPLAVPAGAAALGRLLNAAGGAARFLTAAACDGPGRGGTCDAAAWDAVYLASFWAENTLGWLCFHAHWRSLASFGAFASAGCALGGWFRDYLWLHSGNVVHGFSSAGSQELAALAWAFLLGHLAWATAFMFLASWRGYWQELLESLLWAHLRAPALAAAWTAPLTPAALSIVQARCVGLAHFAAGFIGTFAAFLLSA